VTIVCCFCQHFFFIQMANESSFHSLFYFPAWGKQSHLPKIMGSARKRADKQSQIYMILQFLLLCYLFIRYSIILCNVTFKAWSFSSQLMNIYIRSSLPDVLPTYICVLEIVSITDCSWTLNLQVNINIFVGVDFMFWTGMYVSTRISG